MNLNLTLRGPLGNTISYDQLKDQSIDLVAEKGEDYVGFSGAYFRPDGKPGCLLGELAAQQGATSSSVANRGAVNALINSGYLIPEDFKAERALWDLQQMNDHGFTWFDAVCRTFGMAAVELREEVARRLTPKVEFNTEGYVDWVSSFEVGAEKPVLDLSLPVPSAPAPHVLAA